MFLYRVIGSLDRHKVDYAIVGGFAVALHGAVRGTVDLDLVLSISEGNYTAAEKALQKIGLQSRLPISAREVFEFRKEYIEKRNLIAWSFHNLSNPIEVVDLVLTHDLKKMKIRKVVSQGHTLRVLAIPDLIAMKKASGRPQDLEDIKALEKLNNEGDTKILG